MDASLTAVIIGGVVTLCVAVVGPLLQRDSRRMALQEAELRTKLQPDSDAAKELDTLIARRISGWSDATWYGPLAVGFAGIVIGTAMIAVAIGSDPMRASYIYGVGLFAVSSLFSLMHLGLWMYRTSGLPKRYARWRDRRRTKKSAGSADVAGG